MYALCEFKSGVAIADFIMVEVVHGYTSIWCVGCDSSMRWSVQTKYFWNLRFNFLKDIRNSSQTPYNTLISDRSHQSKQTEKNKLLNRREGVIAWSRAFKLVIWVYCMIAQCYTSGTSWMYIIFLHCISIANHRWLWWCCFCLWIPRK